MSPTTRFGLHLDDKHITCPNYAQKVVLNIHLDDTVQCMFQCLSVLLCVSNHKVIY